MGEAARADVEQVVAVREALRRDDERDRYVETGGKAYVEEGVHAREAVRVLGLRLRALAAEGFGDLAAEARLVWVASLEPMRTPCEVAAVVRLVEEVRAKTAHRSSGNRAIQVLGDLRLTADARGDEAAVDAIALVSKRLGERLQGHRERCEVPTRDAADKALGELLNLLDVLRDRAPEELQ